MLISKEHQQNARGSESMNNINDKPLGMGYIPNLVAFFISLGIAYFLKWEVRDLVWSLWLCSLTLGYLTIFSNLGAGAYLGLHIIRQDDFEKERQVPVIIGGVAIGLFILIFFSLHFGAFHAGHSVFLNIFFPLEGLPGDGFGRAFMNPPLLWILAIRYLFLPYGIFLVPTIIAERQVIFNPFIQVYRGLHPVYDQDGQLMKEDTKMPDISNHPIGATLFRPYINVIRMHLLIFFFAFCYALKIDSFIVYAAVYFVYFFPWPVVWRKNILGPRKLKYK
jgi:hypothetical protein